MNRSLLKENAKIALKRNFWLVMLVVLVAQFLGVADTGIASGGGGGSTYSSSSSSDSGDFSFDDMEEDEKNIFTAITALSVVVIIGIVVVGLVIGWVIAIFLTEPLRVGYRRFFMLNRLDKGKFSDLFSSFCSKYMKIVKSMFTTDLRIFGWSMLFIIPGIIKKYQYYFVPYIMSENPDISGERAREISTQMTDGYKMDIFVLELSFIGWNVLAFLIAIPAAILTCCFLGVGSYFVYTPLAGYMGATYAELYEERREYALFNHIVTPQELCGYDDQTKL